MLLLDGAHFEMGRYADILEILELSLVRVRPRIFSLTSRQPTLALAKLSHAIRPSGLRPKRFPMLAFFSLFVLRLAPPLFADLSDANPAPWCTIW